MLISFLCAWILQQFFPKNGLQWGYHKSRFKIHGAPKEIYVVCNLFRFFKIVYFVPSKYIVYFVPRKIFWFPRNSVYHYLEIVLCQCNHFIFQDERSHSKFPECTTTDPNWLTFAAVYTCLQHFNCCTTDHEVTVSLLWLKLFRCIVINCEGTNGNQLKRLWFKNLYLQSYDLDLKNIT